MCKKIVLFPMGRGWSGLVVVSQLVLHPYLKIKNLTRALKQDHLYIIPFSFNVRPGRAPACGWGEAWTYNINNKQYSRASYS